MVDSVNATSPMAMTARQTGGATTTGSATSGSAFASSDFETFLKMLTTQIKNQDPLNPMEGTEFAVQLATFSGVEQQVQTNTLLQQMLSNGTNGLGELSGWIGRDVRTTAPVWFDTELVSINAMPAPRWRDAAAAGDTAPAGPCGGVLASVFSTFSTGFTLGMPPPIT